MNKNNLEAAFELAHIINERGKMVDDIVESAMLEVASHRKRQRWCIAMLIAVAAITLIPFLLF